MSVLTPFTPSETKPTYIRVNTGGSSLIQSADVDAFVVPPDMFSDLYIQSESEDVGGSFGGGSTPLGGYNSFGSDLDLSAMWSGQDAVEDVQSGASHPLSPNDQDQGRRVRQRT